MAVTSIQSNNKLIQFTRDINREFVRQNLFSPYMGEGLDAVIRIMQDTKSGGEQINIPLVTKLSGLGKATGVLAGAEESINNYGMRLWIDWWRHAVVTTKAESFKDSADVFGIAKPLLSDRGKEIQRDELIQALMAFPTESAPVNLGTDEGQRVNGVLFDTMAALTSSSTFNAYLADNIDRVVFGNVLSNHYTTTTIASATSALSIVGTAQRSSATIVQLLKRRAELCSPKIRPYKTRDGYEYYVLFAGSNAFRDCKLDTIIYNSSLYARERENGGMERNPIFQDGDLMYDGVIIRKVPEISSFVTNNWTALQSGGVSGRIEPLFLCGQQAAALAYGQMAKPTFRKEDDYGFVTGTGIEMAYGVGKIFKKHPMYIPGTTTLNSSALGNTSGRGLSALVQWGVVTGFVSALQDT